MNGHSLCAIAEDYQKTPILSSKVRKTGKEELKKVFGVIQQSVPSKPSYAFFGDTIVNYVYDNCPDSCTVFTPKRSK